MKSKKNHSLKFKVKDMDIATGGTLVAILNTKDAHKLDLHSGDRILLKTDGREQVCILDISESQKAVPEGKIGLFEEVLKKLNVKKDSAVQLKFTGKPESVKHIRSKLYGKRLSYTELLHIIDDITNDRLTDIEKTYFVAAGFVNGWNNEEVVDMTRAMVKTGYKLKFSGITLDKHCIGGVPGNRTTMIVIPIVAAAGFTIPKTSSRAITSPAGTADTMECLARVELPEKKIKQIVKKAKSCIVHGGSMNLAPADDKGVAFLKIEHPQKDDEMRLWLPAFKKVRRISSKKKADSFMGSDLSYEDMTSRELDEYTYEILGEKVVDGIDCHILESTPKSGVTRTYKRFITYVSKTDLVSILDEAYDTRDKLLKRRVMKYRKDKGYDLPVEIFVENVQKGSNTRLVFSSQEVDTGVKADLFQEKNLKRMPK